MTPPAGIGFPSIGRPVGSFSAGRPSNGTSPASSAFNTPEHSMMQVDVRRPERLEGGRLEELYVRHAPGAVRLAYLLTGDRALSEDLVQDAFVRLAGRFVD